MEDNIKTGYVYDPVFLEHTQSYHVENSARLEVIINELQTCELFDILKAVPSRIATREELEYIHTANHIMNVQEISEMGGGHLDPDTYTTPSSFRAASVAAGSIIDLTLSVIDGTVKNGFSLLRPPGHHSLPGRAMGFCIFSNVALAAKAALKQENINRVAIIDFDVHHGNGTQDVFYDDPDVLFISSHLYPFYPGTGSLAEIGEGNGIGKTINIPLSAGVGDIGFNKIYEKIVLPSLLEYKPDMIFVSAGYDSHWNDPLANLGLTLNGLAWVSQTLVEAAENICCGRIIFTLEGGYNLQVLAYGVANSVKALMGRKDFNDPIGKSSYSEPDVTKLIMNINQKLGIK